MAHEIRVRDVLATITLTVTMPAAFGVRVWLATRLIRSAARILGVGVKFECKGGA
jgi:hypothetical protein